MNPICRTCGVIHRGVPRTHMVAPTKVERVMEFSKGWLNRYRRERIELMRRRHNAARP